MRDLAGARASPTRATLDAAARRGARASPAWSARGAPSCCARIFGLDPVRRGAGAASGAFAGPGVAGAGAWRAGVGLLSEDRKGEGLALALSIADNLTLSKLDGLARLGASCRRASARRGELDRAARRFAAAARASASGSCRAATSRRWRSRACCTTTSTCCCSTSRRAASTSGSKAQIYDADRPAGGAPARRCSWSVSYLPELLGVCDRIAVMRRGELGPARPVGSSTSTRVLLEAHGSVRMTRPCDASSRYALARPAARRSSLVYAALRGARARRPSRRRDNLEHHGPPDHRSVGHRGAGHDAHDHRARRHRSVGRLDGGARPPW